jgi:hypothetical protein
MATDFTYGKKQILSSGPFRPSGKDMPNDARTRVEVFADIALIPTPFVGMKITVLVDETNNNKMTDYIVKSLKANSAGIANMLIDEVVRYVDYLGVSGGSSGGGSGEGLTSEQIQQLQTAYEHSQSKHVSMEEVNEAIANAQLGGGEVDLSAYATKTYANNAISTALDGHTFKFLTQSEYDVLETKDPLVVYYITDATSSETIDTTSFATDLSLTGSNLQLKNTQGNLIGNAITLPSTSGGTSETVTVVRDIYANNEMPKMYVTSDRLGSLAMKADGTADCEVEIRFNRQIIKCYATGAVQGTSSESLPAKNYTFKFYSDASHSTKNKIDVGWGKQSKYCFKKNYVDSTHTRNLSGARIAFDMVNSRPESDFKTNLLIAPRNGAVDGFPCIMYLNGDFWGLYTWNIPKDAWMFNMKDDNPNHMVLCAEFNNNGNMSVTNTCQFRALWGGEGDANWSIEAGTYSEALKTSFNNAINFVMTASDEDFKANISNYFDLYSLLDYYCFSYLVYHYDGLGKNMLMATYDGVHWGACLYDMDSIYGVSFNGKEFLEYNKLCPEDYQENNSLLWQRIETCFAQELYDRYVELRKGALSLGNIIEHVEEIYDLIPDRAFKEDWNKWSGIPSQQTNTLTRFRTFMKNRAAYVDSEFEAFDTTPKPVSGVILDQYVVTTNQNSPITLTATVKPNTAINKNVVWSCDDETVELTPSGLTCEVNCPNLGTPKVTVTTEEGGFSASCIITVVEEGTVVTNGLVRYIDLALDEETKATNPTTIKDKVDDSITYNISGTDVLYNQANITNDGVGWKKSGLRGKQYDSGKIGIDVFQYQMPEQFTIECCQSFNNVTVLLKILSIRNSFNDMLFQINTNAGKIQIQNGAKTIGDTYTFESDKLYHIAITYDGITARLLINGVEVIAPQAYTKAGDSTTFYVRPFGISDGANVEGTVEGLMCYFKIYNRVLNDNELAANYAIESANRVMDK